MLSQSSISTWNFNCQLTQALIWIMNPLIFPKGLAAMLATMLHPDDITSLYFLASCNKPEQLWKRWIAIQQLQHVWLVERLCKLLDRLMYFLKVIDPSIPKTIFWQEGVTDHFVQFHSSYLLVVEVGQYASWLFLLLNNMVWITLETLNAVKSVTLWPYMFQIHDFCYIFMLNV